MSDTDESEASEYEIERILADRVVEGEVFYLVKWKGYPDEECTWEPADNFNSQVPITEWKDQKVQGLDLPEDFLVRLQRRMDSFQAGNRNYTSRAVSAGYQADSDDLTDTDGSARRSSKKQKVHSMDANPSQQATRVKTETLRKKGIASIIRKSHVPASSSSSLRTGPATKSVTSVGVDNAASGLSNSKAGQRFRNLSHMNNARKKARQEPAPTLAPDQLKRVEDFAIGRTAPTPPVPSSNPPSPRDSPLFFPDEENGMNRRPSPTRSDSVLFPPARVDHQTRSERVPSYVRASVETSYMDNDNGIATEVKAPTRDELAPSVDVPSRLPANTGLDQHTDTAARLPTSRILHPTVRGFTSELTSNFPLAPNPSLETIIHAYNGRFWYRGDIMCNFSMGNSIGDATIIHLPFHPFGSQLVSIKRDETLRLNFESHAYSKTNYEEAFRNSYLGPLALGLVCPFPDTQEAFDEFAAYLEQHDSAAVFHFPTNNLHFSLLLYSINARSWRYLGWQPARLGRPRLHVAFVPKLVPRQTRQNSFQSVAMTTLNFRSPPPAQQATNSSEGRHRSLSVSHDITDTDTDAVAKTPKTPKSPGAISEYLSSAPQSPVSDLEGNERCSSAIMSHHPLSKSKSIVSAPANRSMLPRSKSGSDKDKDYRLSYKRLIMAISSNSKLNGSITRTRFFLAFATSYPHEAASIQKWLEQWVAASNVYLDSERHDWTRFREKADTTPSVLLFHSTNLNYNRLRGLGSVLISDALSCFSLSFELTSNKEIDISLVRICPLFPRAAMYLITESMILNDIEGTIVIVKHFDKTKNSDYLMLMPPDIERWTIGQMVSEKNDARQGKLLDFLVLIRRLRPGSDISDIIETSNQSSSTSYIISPQRIPGYDSPPALVGDLDGTRASQANFAQDYRDNLLRSYFYCYAATHARTVRRFVMFIFKSKMAQHEAELKKKTEDDMYDCGHVVFHEFERFVEKMRSRENGNREVGK